jgi:hypothetical protein
LNQPKLFCGFVRLCVHWRLTQLLLRAPRTVNQYWFHNHHRVSFSLLFSSLSVCFSFSLLYFYKVFLLYLTVYFFCPFFSTICLFSKTTISLSFFIPVEFLSLHWLSFCLHIELSFCLFLRFLFYFDFISALHYLSNICLSVLLAFCLSVFKSTVSLYICICFNCLFVRQLFLFFFFLSFEIIICSSLYQMPAFQSVLLNFFFRTKQYLWRKKSVNLLWQSCDAKMLQIKMRK